VTAVTTVRPAAWDKFFAPKAARAVTTTASFDMDMDFIDKHERITSAADGVSQGMQGTSRRTPAYHREFSWRQNCDEKRGKECTMKSKARSRH
jgi:hypothetical protein